MPLLVIVRHGQSAWNLENRFTGEVDIDLTPLGREEARLAGEKLKTFVFGHCFTSALKRAQESLSLILEEMGGAAPPIIIDKALNERNYGDLQGLNKAETARKYGDAQVALWRRSYAVKPPGGESLKDTADRVLPYYRQQIEPLLKAGENILIVAHGNSLRALMMHLENISAEAIADTNLPTGQPRVYMMDENLKIEKVAYL
ncbi:MAG: 2,3-bisphosphoglycerate-dependent phosphoglycerate mutase [Puia sp.]|nr:2,3-bisphosphoglycerate-dependent phosphoglycerate mutase [Puia sp.]